MKKGMAVRMMAVWAVSLAATAAVGLGGSGGCGSSTGGTGGGGSVTPSVSAATVARNYAAIVLASYEDSLARAEALHDAVDAFVAAPSEETFQAAKDAWKAAREPYGQTEAYRFYNGPIDNEEDGPEGLINAWPLDEAYIDYVEGNAGAGIVNDPGVALTAEGLAALNENGADDAISTGYHAIEFLLWGQDLNAAPGDAGLRPFTDFVDGGTAANQDRRRLYLETAAHLLTENLGSLVAAWAEGSSDNYRAEFLAADENEALRRIIVGLGSLAGGELAGERMSVALVTKDQEDEHSCFSDNTHRDVFLNFQGLLNVYRGSYTRIDGTVVGDGTGIEDLVDAADPDLGTRIGIALGNAQAAMDGIVEAAEGGTAFDRQILGADTDPGRQRVRAAVDALESFAALLSEAAEALGVDIDLDGDGA